jgi:hypothetical protein
MFTQTHNTIFGLTISAEPPFFALADHCRYVAYCTP